jgi:hypothetical protein
MPDTKLLDTVACREALESFRIESEPAFFQTNNGDRFFGHAAVSTSRSSIAIRFTASGSLALPKAGYGEANGQIGAVNGTWRAPRVNDAGPSAAGDRLFATQELVIGRDGSESVAATRLVLAGAAWRGSEALGGRRFVASPLSHEVVSHHDARLSIAAEGVLDDTVVQAIDRASSFIAGIDLELLRIDAFSSGGELVQARHLRGFRRVGRGPHSPFTGIADEHRMRAWGALVEAIPHLEKERVPIITMINHIGSHNNVAEINTSAALLLLATQTMCYDRTHGGELVSGAASYRHDLKLLSDKLSLGLRDEDLDRFEKLRAELLDAGFFHKPGYETGRPQKDIKFLRDIAHMIVFRLCGYAGPFYGAETFAVRDISSAS